MSRRLFVEAHCALVGQLLGDGETVSVPVATAKSFEKKQTHTRKARNDEYCTPR